MAIYIVKQHNDNDSFKEIWNTRYIIYKKRWYGWSWKIQTNDIDEVSKMVSNLVKQGHIVLTHWTVTQELKYEKLLN